MSEATRKPNAAAPARSTPPPGAETKVVQNVRYRPSELARFREHAKIAGLSFTTYMNKATIEGDRILFAEAIEKAHVRATG